jgi:hypothetical protein
MLHSLFATARLAGSQGSKLELVTQSSLSSEIDMASIFSRDGRVLLAKTAAEVVVFS